MHFEPRGAKNISQDLWGLVGLERESPPPPSVTTYSRLHYSKKKSNIFYLHVSYIDKSLVTKKNLIGTNDFTGVLNIPNSRHTVFVSGVKTPSILRLLIIQSYGMWDMIYILISNCLIQFSK